MSHHCVIPHSHNNICSSLAVGGFRVWELRGKEGGIVCWMQGCDRKGREDWLNHRRVWPVSDSCQTNCLFCVNICLFNHITAFPLHPRDCCMLSTHMLCCDPAFSLSPSRWVGYELPGFAGEQFVLEKGEYPRWSTWTNSQSTYYLRSFRPLKVVSILYKETLQEHNACISDTTADE